MVSIENTLRTIFGRFSEMNKSRCDFFIELFETIPCVRGRMNFTNIARYSKYDESTFRRNYSKFFDWVKFNYYFLQIAIWGLGEETKEIIGAIDCSFVSKSGKHTSNLDKFWSGVSNRAKKGLEISLVCLIDVSNRQRWSFDVRQTPAGLSSKEGVDGNYTRTDFYIDQLQDCFAQLSRVTYYTGDGFYAKEKVINAFNIHNKHLISKLRCDANLNYLLDRDKNPDAHGNKKYDEKVNWKALNLDNWTLIGADEKYAYLRLYTQILYSPKFKCKLKVVFVWNTKTNTYVLLFSTDLMQDARQIIKYYQLRFQIEFIFRDAKQFMGLTHCQARDEDKMDFHFNMCFTALNLYQHQLIQENSSMSMNSLVRKAYNSKLIKILFDKLRSEPEFDGFFDLKHPIVQDVINLGQMRA